jgi:elongation factor P
MVAVGDVRNGQKIEMDGEAYEVVEAQHVKPGKGGAFCRTRMKNMRTGAVIERTFRVGEKLQVPDVEEKQVSFLYSAENELCFMDLKTYEQFSLTREQVGDSKNYLKENMELGILFYNGRPIGIDLPMFVVLKVVQTDPGIRGDTASGGTKPAVLETGAVVKVPLYLNEGETIKIDTRTGAFIERVK